MGVYKRKDSVYYWLFLERRGEKALREATSVRVDGGPDAARLAKRTYDERMLQLAHEKNIGYKRPSPTKPGAGWSYIYFLRLGDTIKIGRAVNVERRIRELQVAHPNTLKLLAVVPAHIALETELQRRFSALRVNREWFRAEEPLLAFIERVQRGEHPVGILAGGHAT
jgi:plasmid stabilization system protein ParE